jgi:hypothetical protein
MRSIPSIVTLLAFAASSALAQTGGLPALEARVNALEQRNVLLQNQIDSLTGSFLGLQKQVDTLSAALPMDDGTAAALVGTWQGPGNSLEFATSQLFLTLNGMPTPFISVPRTGGGHDQYGVISQFAPPIFGAPNTITITISRDSKLGMHLTGTATSTDQPSQQITLRGIALSNGFFLLRAFAGGTGTCAPTIYQAVGALNLDRTVLTVIGSGLDANCQHSVFRLQLGKQ